MDGPKAIETIYNGYRFRSRLEARWAVFFHHAGIPFEYEKEGYDLDSAGWYLPDFWLPDLELWVEIKPSVITEDAETKIKALAAETGYWAMLAALPPWEWHEDGGISNRVYGKTGNRTDNVAFGKCIVCKRISPAVYGDARYCSCYCLKRLVEIAPLVTLDEVDQFFNDQTRLLLHSLKTGEWDDRLLVADDLMAAGLAAKQARFEYGEKG